MKRLKFFLIVSFLCYQGCFFGTGLIEQSLDNDFYLFANNSFDETSIIYNTGKYSSSIIVEESVFAVGFNDDFIIAKRHPKDSINQILEEIIYYYIIEINNISKNNPKKSIPLSEEQYKSKRRELKIPNNLDFKIVIKEIE